MLEAGAVVRDLEPAAPHPGAIDAKPESATGNELALPWLSELTEQEDPIASVPLAAEASTANPDARTHRTMPGRDAHVDRTSSR
jgi:hypothetical protein